MAVDVLMPLASLIVGEAVSVNEAGGPMKITGIVALVFELELACTFAVRADEYGPILTLAMPLASVVAEPTFVPPTVNVTVLPLRFPVDTVTVAVALAVLVPSALSVKGLTERLTDDTVPEAMTGIA